MINNQKSGDKSINLQAGKDIVANIFLNSTPQDFLKEIKRQNKDLKKVSKSKTPLNEVSDKEEKIKLLKVLMKRSAAGFHSNIGIAKFETVVGTVGFRLFSVFYERDIKIFDLIGGISKNRISVIMKSKNKIKIIVLDSIGNSHTAELKLPQSSIGEFIVLTWDAKHFSIWSKGEKIKLSLSHQLRGEWVALTSGIDVDGDLGANYVVQGAIGGGGLGLGLCSADKSVQVIISHMFFFPQMLSKKEIEKLDNLNSRVSG